MRRSAGREDGAGLVLVVGLAGVALSLVATALLLSTTALEQSRVRSDYEMSLASAEAGIDWTLARLQESYRTDPVGQNDFPIPGSQTGTLCTGVPVAQQSFSTTEAEGAWARQQLDQVAASGCVQTTDSGQYAILKPASPTSAAIGRVYAMGWSPSRSAPRKKQRLIKVEYQFLPYTPAQAVLTQGSLELDASATITSAYGFDPTTAAVHTNGVITTTGNPTVTGPVSSVGASTATSSNFSANAGGVVQSGSSRAGIPAVSAAAMYRRIRDLDPGATADGRWFDLCPDGQVRAYSTDGPCAPGAAVYGSPGASWDGASHTWTVSRTAPDGTYFAHHANIVNGTGNAEFDNLTLIAESEGSDCATKQYGNITWDHYDIEAPAVSNTLIVADADLNVRSNFVAGESEPSEVTGGLIVAGDQLHLETSSNSVVGAVVSADQCTTSPLVTSNVVKNVTILFDPKSKSPFATVANQNLWLELPSA